MRVGLGGGFGGFDVERENGNQNSAAHPAGQNRVERGHFGAVGRNGIDLNFVSNYGARNKISNSFGIILKEANEVLNYFAIFDGIDCCDCRIEVRLEIG